MDEIQRRAFMKGAAIGALAFSVGGAEVMLTPRQAQAQNIPLRTLTPEQAATLGAMGETLVPGAQSRRHRQFRRSAAVDSAGARRCLKRASSTCGRLTRTFIAPRSAPSRARARPSSATAFAALTAAEQHDFVDLMRQNKLDGWKGPARPSSISCCAPTRSTWSTAPWMATPISACPISRISHRRRAGEEAPWPTKKSMSSLSAPALRARSMPRCWPRPARRSWCWSTGPIGSLPT